jgi:hypothetical protein
MNRDRIIAKTLEDMRHYERSFDAGAHEQSVERDEHDRSVTIPELIKRLPDGEILTCAELDLPVECCESCHSYYPQNDMYAVDLLDGKKAWICCEVRRALFHEPSGPYVDLEEALGGGLRRQNNPDQE